jgi:hypothetical protein
MRVVDFQDSLASRDNTFSDGLPDAMIMLMQHATCQQINIRRPTIGSVDTFECVGVIYQINQPGDKLLTGLSVSD